MRTIPPNVSVLLFSAVQFVTWLCVTPCSYMDTEQYEEAVRDYEKVYQTEKTSGKLLSALSSVYISELIH